MTELMLGFIVRLRCIGMLHDMSRTMVTLLGVLLLASAGSVAARTLQAQIDKVTTPVATLENVTIRLHWPADATSGQLRLAVGHLQADDLGYDFRNLLWTCPLVREQAGWRCAGGVRSAAGGPLQLALALTDEATTARLSEGASRIDLRLPAASGAPTSIDLTQVPATWAQAFLAQVWDTPTLQAGTLDSQLQIHTSSDDVAADSLRVTGRLQLSDIGFDTPDGRIAGLGLGGGFQIDYHAQGGQTQLGLDGALQGGEALFGKAYLALPKSAVAIEVDASHQQGEGWRLPHFSWRDAGTLTVSGRAAFAPDTSLHTLNLHVQSRNMTPLPAQYLSGWLGPAGLGELKLEGAMDAELSIESGLLHNANVHFNQVDVNDPDGRFRLDGVDGQLCFTAGEQAVKSQLGWQSGALYELGFGAAVLPMASRNGLLSLEAPTSMAMLGGKLQLEHLALRPPWQALAPAFGFGLMIDQLDIGKLAKTLGWPAFKGTLSGRIPNARYVNDRLNLDGGLTVQLFDGQVQVTALSLERPFGTAPSLSADIAIDDLKLEALTGVFGFGSISGRLDGRINDLRLVNWHPTRFDAALYTDPTAGVEQNISQRAVQSISSVGDASFASSLQGRLIAFVDTFGYRRIGISCRLVRQVCAMGGLHSGDNTFTIVQGAGLPRLTVIGHNRLVDWPTLVKRVAAIGKGEIKPVVD